MYIDGALHLNSITVIGAINVRITKRDEQVEEKNTMFLEGAEFIVHNSHQRILLVLWNENKLSNSLR